ncbi:MAG: DUF4878 domain-containing protein [Prevotella sp.]|nr:DUF4878 domain-containing protein [Prevotella sp.]MBQ9649610.1 DUF4878 domain-containing protein [Prevotella sp.]
MKKVLSVVLVCLVAAVVMSCSSNSPRDIAEQAMKCMQKKDVRGYMDYVYFSEKDQPQKEGYVKMIEEKVNKNADVSKEIDSFKFVEEKIDEEAGIAKEIFDITYKDGSTKQEAIDMMRDENGKWWVKLSK